VQLRSGILQGLVRGLFVVVLIAAPAVGLLLVNAANTHELSGIEAKPEALFVPATTVEVDDRQPVVATIHFGSAVVVRSSGGTGLVTSVAVQPGDTLTHLEPTYSVDGVVITAAATAEPFFRPLRLGDSGSDVEDLRRVLTETGYLDSETTEDAGVLRFDASMRSALMRFQSAAGVEKPTGIFTPDLFLWLPHEELSVRSVLVEAGESAPSLGTEVVVSQRNVVLFELSTTDGEDFGLPAEGFVFQPSDSDAIVDLSAIDLNEVLNAIVELEFSDQSGTVDGVVKRTNSLELVVIPASALVLQNDGRMCVWVQGASALAARAVNVASSRPTGTLLSSGVAATEVVLVNPADLDELPPCQ